MYLSKTINNPPDAGNFAMLSLSKPTSLEQWHIQLAHCSPLTLQEMAKNGLVDGLVISETAMNVLRFFLSYMLDAHLSHFRVIINMFPSDCFRNMHFYLYFSFHLNMRWSSSLHDSSSFYTYVLHAFTSWTIII